MATDSFIVYIKTEDIYSHMAKYVKTKFDTLSYELDKIKGKSCLKEKIKK